MSISALYCKFDARAVAWDMWKSSVLAGGWTGWRPRRERPQIRLAAPRVPRGPETVRALDGGDAAALEPVQRRCQARGCITVFLTADLAELRCPSCRAARRKIPPLEASHCGCAAAMCAGV